MLKTNSIFKQLVVIIPTYNAKNTIQKVITNVLSSAPGCAIFVVDDNSPDKTAQIVKNKFRLQPLVRVIVRSEKGGRGSAVIHGLGHAMEDKNILYFVEMDADLCHNPKYIPVLVNSCDKTDVAIASRYKKGSKNYNWKLQRQIFSRSVSFFLRLMLGVPINDYTNGFRCYRRRAVLFIVKQHFISKGFIVLSEIVFKLHKKGFMMTEIPFTFRLYEKNPSNFNTKELKEAFVTVLRLRFPFLLHYR